MRKLTFILIVLAIVSCLYETGEINRRELLNRQLLREIMTEAGWLVEPSEWWHFNAMTLTEASERLTVIK